MGGSGRQRCWFSGGSTVDYLPIDVRSWITEWLARPTSILFGILPPVPIPQSLAMYPDSLL